MLNNDTQKNYDALMGRIDEITEQRVIITQKAKEYEIEEESKKEERIINLANECTEMLEKAIANIDYPSLVHLKHSPIDLNLIGKSFTEYLEKAELVIDNVLNGIIIRLYYTKRFPIKKLEWNDRYGCSNLFGDLYQIFAKRHPERDNIPCIRIIRSPENRTALDVIFSNEPIEKEKTKPHTR